LAQLGEIGEAICFHHPVPIRERALRIWIPLSKFVKALSGDDVQQLWMESCEPILASSVAFRTSIENGTEGKKTRSSESSYSG
jgi:hypothetical protein